MTLLTTCLLLVLFALAARQDVLTRLIPGIVPAGITCIVLASRLPAVPLAVIESLAAGGGVFVLLFIAYCRGAIGGGDVRLLTALSVGLPPLATLHFIVATIMAGGVIGVLYYVLGKLRLSPAARDASGFRRILAVESWRARRFRAVPYALAIAAGAAIVLLPPVLPIHAAIGALIR